MNTSTISSSTIHTNFLFQSALKRISQLEEEINRLKNPVIAAPKFIRVLQANKLSRILVMDILYIQSESNYSRIFTKDGEQHYTSKTLKYWASEIEESDFIRCHRSFLVNQKEMVEFNRITNHLVLRNGVIIPTSRRYQKAFLRSFCQTKAPGKSVPDPRPACAVHTLHFSKIKKKEVILPGIG